MAPSPGTRGDDEDGPDSIPDGVEQGAITGGPMSGSIDIDDATITHLGDVDDLTRSTDGSSGIITTGTGRRSGSTPGSTGLTTEDTGLLKGRLARPHVGHEKYVPAQELGRGGMGVVKRVLDIDLRRDVAMKVMLPDPRESKYARFIEEAQVTGQLEHPNIVPVHDLGIDTEGCPFFTMKLVDGQPLSTLLERQRKGDANVIGQWPLGRLLGAFMGICNGIAYAHEHGVVHRDLKPANIMLGGFGEVQVMDWGLAKIGAVRHAGKRVQSLRDDLIRRATTIQKKDGSDSHSIADASQTPPVREPEETDNPFETQMGDRGAGTMTHDGSVMGTPVYMPPEQARGAIDEIDERSDVYSLGAILYEILTLKAPVSGDSAKRILERVKAGAIIAPERRTPQRDIPRELSAIAMKALATDPADRYQRADELLHDVQLFVEGKTVSAKDDSSWEAFVKLVKRNKPVSLAVGIAGILLVATVTVAFSIVLRYWSDAEAARIAADEAKEQAMDKRDEAKRNLADFKREAALRAEAEEARRKLDQQINEENQRNWHIVRRERFGNRCFEHWRAYTGYADPPALLDAADRREWLSFKPNGMKVQHKREVLHLVYDQPLGESVRITFAGTVDEEEIGGLNVVLRGSRWNRGYVFHVGGWMNSRAAIQRSTGLNARVLAEAPFHLEPGRRYVIEATMIKNRGSMRLSLKIDGEQILLVDDGDPLAAGGDGDCAIWLPAPAAATLHWAHVSVLGAPLKEDLLATADRHLGKGNYQTAFDLYQEVAEAGIDPDRIAQAKVGMGKASDLLAAADKLTKWRGDLKRVWHDLPWSLELNESSLVCTVSGTAVVNINPLRGLPLDHLTLFQTKVGDLRLLRGMPLTQLMVAGGRVRDLAPLADLPLQDLTLSGNPIRDLTPLSLLPISHLDISGSPELSDLRPLANCHELEVLILNDCPELTDLSPLRALSLHHLELAGCPALKDLGQLDLLPLRSMVIDQSQCEATLGILSGLPQLERIMVRDDKDRPTGYRPDEFWQRYGLGQQGDIDDGFLPQRQPERDIELPELPELPFIIEDADELNEEQPSGPLPAQAPPRRDETPTPAEQTAP